MDFVKSDPGLDVLLELNDTEYTDESGYRYKIEAYRVSPTRAISMAFDTISPCTIALTSVSWDSIMPMR